MAPAAAIMFHLESQIFVTMATSASLGQLAITPLNFLPSITFCLLQTLSISYCQSTWMSVLC